MPPPPTPKTHTSARVIAATPSFPSHLYHQVYELKQRLVEAEARRQDAERRQAETERRAAVSRQATMRLGTVRG